MNSEHRMEDGIIKRMPTPEGEWVVKNRSDEVVVTSKGTTVLVGCVCFCFLVFTAFPAMSLSYARYGRTGWAVVVISYACLLLALLLHAVIAREWITATPDSLEVVRRGLLGKRTRRLGPGSITIGAPGAGLTRALRPHLVAMCEGVEVRMGFALKSSQRDWLGKRLMILWDEAHVAEPPREAR